MGRVERKELRAGLVQACDDRRLLRLKLWPRQRDLLGAVEHSRMHVWALGRRSGKTTLAAVVCLWDATLRPELGSMVRVGEVRYAVAVATNLAQARLIVSAARSIVERSRVLSGLVESMTDDEIRFRLPDGSRTAVRAFPCSSRGGRGYPISTLVLDEAAFFVSETDGFQTAERVWNALAPSTAQFGDAARIIVASTPFGQTGLFAELHGRAAAGELEGAVAQNASTRAMNPTISDAFLAAEEARDPDSFRSEYLAEFVGSGGAFIDFERVPIARPDMATDWVAGLDPAFSRDPFGVALVGRSRGGAGLVVGPVRALRAEGEFAVVDEVAAVCREFGARAVTDQFAAAAVVDRLRTAGVDVDVHTMSAGSKTAIFQQLRAVLYGGLLALPDMPALEAELRRLRTRFSAGSAAVYNPRVGGSHGDMAQALAIAVYALHGAEPGPITTMPNPWDCDWAAWAPGHDPFDQRHVDWARSHGCDECAAERRAERERAAAPPPAPAPVVERVGNFEIRRDPNRPRRS